MYCTRCGCQTGELDRFCSQCGTLAPGQTSSSLASLNAAPQLPPHASAPPVLGEPMPQLTRSLRNRKIAGVCAGIGNHFGVDPTVVRILFVVMFFCPVLPAIIPYLVCWIVMPLERPQPAYGPVAPGYPLAHQSFAAPLAR